MNMKRITDVPVIEELGENSYVLVDNNGEAARIPGSKVGGGGGNRNEMPDLLYGVKNGNGFLMCSSPDEATAVDYETGKPWFLHDRAFYGVQKGAVVGVYAAGGAIDMYDEVKAIVFNDVEIYFSDTEIPES